MRYSIVILLCLCASSPLLAQQFVTGGSTNLYIGERARFYVGPQTEFSGMLENLGQLVLAGQGEFNQDQQGGDVTLTGSNATSISSSSLSTLRLNSLTIDTSQPVDVSQLDSLIIDGNLTLNGQLVNTSGTRLLVNGTVSTATDRGSFVEGQLAIHSDAGGQVIFPMGAGGNFNAITLDQVPIASTVSITSRTDTPPNGDILRDSITAISDIRWNIVFENNNDTNRFVFPTLTYSGQNLQSNVVNRINALNFAPVVAVNIGDDQWRSMGRTGDVPNGFNTGATLSSEDGLAMFDPTIPIEIAVGRIPTAEGLNLYVPTAFTPNGVFDENKTFRPFLVGADIAFIRFKVWDRYNRLIHNIEQDLPDMEAISWDGTMPNGTPATSGIYYYSVDLRVLDDVLSQSGTVLLIR